MNKAVPLNQHGTCYVIGEQCQFTTVISSMSFAIMMTQTGVLPTVDLPLASGDLGMLVGN
jgi:hypothetical protein